MRNDKEQTIHGEEMVTISRAEYENMQAQLQWLMEQLRLSLLFNEAEVYADQTAKEDNSSVAVAAHKQHRKHEYTLDELPENVPVEVVEHRLPEEDLACPSCGSTMTEIGKEVRVNV